MSNTVHHDFFHPPRWGWWSIRVAYLWRKDRPQFLCHYKVKSTVVPQKLLHVWKCNKDFKLPNKQVNMMIPMFSCWLEEFICWIPKPFHTCIILMDFCILPIVFITKVLLCIDQWLCQICSHFTVSFLNWLQITFFVLLITIFLCMQWNSKQLYKLEFSFFNMSDYFVICTDFTDPYYIFT